MFQRTRSRQLSIVVVGAALALGACQSLPRTNRDRLPAMVGVSDGSAERLTMNRRVWDVAIPIVARRFYVEDYGGVDWPALASARREAAVTQPNEIAFYAALNETLALLNDRHTGALRPAVNLGRAEARLGQGRNYGFTVSEIEGQAVVVDVDQDGPAAAAGVRVGWLIDALDGRPFDNNNSSPADGPRQFLFLDAADQRHEITLVAVVRSHVPGAAHRTPTDVLVLWFQDFDRRNRDWFLDRLKTEMADPPRGVVVDLRGNGGGDSGDLGRLLAPFLPNRSVYAVTEARSVFGRRRATRRRALAFDGPLAVLTSERSASAAELFAAAIQEAGRGPIVGRRTAGAVVGSTQYDLPDGGRLSVGFTAVRTGGGVLLEGVGVTPDIVTSPTLADLRAGRDPTLTAALEALTTARSTPSSADGGD